MSSNSISASEGERRLNQRTLLWRAGLLGGIVLIVLAYLRWPLWPDHSLYLIMGRYWFEGILPYRDVFEQNWPGNIWIAQVTLLLFGDTPLAVRLFDLLWQTATGTVLYLLSRRYFDRPWRAGCVILYFSIYLAATFGSTATRDTFASLPLGLALYAVTAQEGRFSFLRGILIGVMLAVAILIKPTLALVAVLLLPFLAGYGLWKRAHGALMILAGSLTGLALCTAVFIRSFMDWGILSSFVDAAIGYAGVHYAQESFFWMGRRALIFMLFYPPGRLIVISLMVGFLCWRARPKWGWRDMALLLFFLGTLGSLLVQRKFNYVHAMPVAFFGSLSTLLGIEKNKTLLATQLQKYTLVAVSDFVWVILGWALVLPVWLDLPKSMVSLVGGQSMAAYGDSQRLSRGLPSWSMVREVGKVVQANTPLEAKLVCLAGPASTDFYLASHRPPGQKYVNPVHLGYDPKRIDEVRRGLSKNKIDILIFSKDETDMSLKEAIANLLQKGTWIKLFEQNIILPEKEKSIESNLLVYASSGATQNYVRK